MSNSENIHPVFDQLLTRAHKERLLAQRGQAVWLYGLSGSGKTTLANGLERRLYADGRLTQILDGDNIRTGLNRNLGFSEQDRFENIRRIAEVAKLFLHAGVITINSFITPKRDFRRLAREIIGDRDFLEVHVMCRFETCERRDVKGLYEKARTGNLQQFTGRDASFEPPHPGEADLVIDTDVQSIEESVEALYQLVATRISLA